MKKFFLLSGLIGAMVNTPNEAKALLAVTNLPFYVQDASDRGCNTKNQCSKGAVTWSVSLPYVTLWLADAPVSYTTSLGEEISFQVFFKQRDTLAPYPGLFKKWYGRSSSLGVPADPPPPPPPAVPPTGWLHNWFSYIRFSGTYYGSGQYSQDITDPMQDFSSWTATVHLPGGGEVDFSSDGSYEAYGSKNDPQRTQCWLLPMNGTNQHIYPAITNSAPGPNVPFGGRNAYGQVGFRLVHADGSQDLYGFVTELYGISAVGDALLTEHVDPSGNSIKFTYTGYQTAYGTHYLLASLVDYDGKTTTLTYTSNLLTRVDMPYNRYATFQYDQNQNLTNITDAATNASTMDYAYNTAATRYLPWRVTTPHSATEFEYHYDDNPQQAGIEVGNASGTNRVTRAIRVTHADNSRELFAYRPDSQAVGIPAAAQAGVPLPPLGALDDGSTTNHWLSPFYLRNSFHWNRQQYAALSSTNFALSGVLSLTTNDYKLATVTRWLAGSLSVTNTFLSDVPSMVREASPDGVQPGARVWFDYGNATPYVIGNVSQTVVCQLMPDGTTRYTQNGVDSFGLPDGATSTYELDNGGVGTRTVDYHYDSYAGSQTCTVSNNQISYVEWTNLMLTKIIGPQGETLVSLSAPANESVTNSFITNSVLYTYVTTRPQRRVLNVTNALNETATVWFNTRQQPTGARLFNGVTLTNFYDYSGWLTETINLSAQATNSMSFTNGLLLTHTNALGLVTQHAWDSLERPITVRFPDNTGVTNAYTNSLLLTSQTDRLGNVSTFGYNFLGQLVQVIEPPGRITEFDYCRCGSPDEVTDPVLGRTFYTYDYNGRLRYEVDSDNFTRTYTRNTVGQLTNLTDTAGNNLTIAYNHQGLVKRVSNPAGTLYQVVYDIRDRPIFVTNTYGAVVSTTYDYFNRPLTRTLLNNGVASTETYTYNTNGLATYTDPQQRVTRYGYDSAGRMFAVTNANQEVVSTTFNKLGQMLTLTDGRVKTTRWAYDIYGRLTAETNANNVLVRTNGYDPNGRLTNQWTAAKGKTTYVYDAGGRITSVRYPTSTNSYSYDDLNRVTAATSSAGSLTRTYTNLGAFQSALKSEDGPWAADTLTIYRNGSRWPYTMTLEGSTARTWDFEGDSLNRLKNLGITGGQIFNFNYTGAGGRLNKVNLPGGNWITNSFDPAGQLLGRWLKNSGGTTLDSFAYTHDLTGLRTNLVRSDGTYANYIYDPIGQLTNAVAREPGGALRRNENFAYDFDEAGNLATRHNATLTQTFAANNLNQLSTINRSGTLTAAGTANTLAQTVSVNNVGADLYTDDTFATTNGLTLTNGNNQLRFKATDAYSQSVTVTQVFNLPSSVSYTYDLNGNLISDGSRGYDFDDADQLVRITATNQWKSEFVYDAFGRRIVRKEFVWQSSAWSLKDEVHYVWLGMSVLQERDAANNVRVTYTGRLAREDTTSTSFYFADGNGNISSLIDSSGNVKARYRYDCFGNLLSKSGPLADANLIRFSGKEYHANSGLYYYGFRFYAPNLQRWMNEDPIGIAGGLNFYGFVGNDPINYNDPLGLKTGDSWDVTTYIWPSLAELEGKGQLDQRAKEMGYHDYADAMVQLDAHRGRDTCDIWTGRQMQQAVSATAGSAGELGRAYLETASQLAAAGVATKPATAGSRMGEVQSPGWLSKIWNRLFGKGTPKSAAPLERALGNTSDDLAEQAAKSCPVESPFKGGCFIGETVVIGEKGYQQIQDIGPGDRVWSYNMTTGRWELGIVERTFVHEYQGDIISVSIEGDTVEATGNHPFWVINGRNLCERPEANDVPSEEHALSGTGRWVEARDLLLDDELLLKVGKVASVVRLTSRWRSVSVYNIQVAGNRTYAVSKGGILVHNKAAQIAPVQSAKQVAEAATKSRAEQYLNRSLSQSRHVGFDYVDDLGRTYDQMGNAAMIPYWNTQRAQFFNQINRHVQKADFTIIDLTGFPANIKEDVANHILSLPQPLFDKIVPIGF